MILLWFYHNYASGPGTVRRARARPGRAGFADEDEKRPLQTKPTIWNVKLAEPKLDMDEFEVRQKELVTPNGLDLGAGARADLRETMH
jgi:hypothetical protein